MEYYAISNKKWVNCYCFVISVYVFFSHEFLIGTEFFERYVLFSYCVAVPHSVIVSRWPKIYHWNINQANEFIGNFIHICFNAQPKPKQWTWQTYLINGRIFEAVHTFILEKKIVHLFVSHLLISSWNYGVLNQFFFRSVFEFKVDYFLQKKWCVLDRKLHLWGLRNWISKNDNWNEFRKYLWHPWLKIVKHTDLYKSKAQI